MGNKASFNKLLKQMQESEERIKKEISEKDYHCRAAVADKANYETRILKLNGEVQAISAEFQAARKVWESEKAELQSQIVAEGKEREEMSVQNQRDLLQCRAENVQLEDQLSFLAAAKMILEEETRVLQTEMDRRALVSEENELSLQRKVKELEATLESVEKDRDSLRASSMEKKNIIVDLEHKLSETEEENRSLSRDLNKNKIVAEVHACQIRELENKARELESNLQSVSTNRHLTSKRPLFQMTSLSQDGEENCGEGKENRKVNYGQGRENGKENSSCVRAKSKGGSEGNTKASAPKRVLSLSLDERTSSERSVVEKQSTKSRSTSERSVVEKQSTKSRSTSSEPSMVEKQTTKSRVPLRRTPQQTVSEKPKPGWIY